MREPNHRMSWSAKEPVPRSSPQSMTDGETVDWKTHRPCPSARNNSRHALCCVPKFLSGTQCQMPTVVTSLITPPFTASCSSLSYFLSPLPKLPKVTSHRNYYLTLSSLSQGLPASSGTQAKILSNTFLHVCEQKDLLARSSFLRWRFCTNPCLPPKQFISGGRLLSAWGFLSLETLALAP